MEWCRSADSYSGSAVCKFAYVAHTPLTCNAVCVRRCRNVNVGHPAIKATCHPTVTKVVKVGLVDDAYMSTAILPKEDGMLSLSWLSKTLRILHQHPTVSKFQSTGNIVTHTSNSLTHTVTMAHKTHAILLTRPSRHHGTVSLKVQSCYDKKKQADFAAAKQIHLYHTAPASR